ncbi:hypothetical protein PVK73_27475, partial [Bacillus thuringiensis]
SVHSIVEYFIEFDKIVSNPLMRSIYKEKDNFYNVVVYYNGEFVEVNVKRITLEVAAKELYPEGYDLNTLFVDYKERKMQHDIERGSKKALRKIQKEIRNKKE